MSLFWLWGKKLPISKLDKGKGENLISMGFSYLWGSVFPNAMIKKNVKLVPKPSVTAAAGEG